RGANRHPAGGSLLSGRGQERRRPPAAAGMRADLAEPLPRADAPDRADPAGGELRPSLPSRRPAQGQYGRDGGRLAGIPPPIPAAAPSELAQHRLAQAQSLVRERAGAGAAPARAGVDLADRSERAFLSFITPAKAGVQGNQRESRPWIPARNDGFER